MNTRHNALNHTLAALGLWLCAMCWVPMGAASTAIHPGTPWAARNALRHVMPDPGTVPMPRDNRFVGIFFFLTAGCGGPQRRPTKQQLKATPC